MTIAQALKEKNKKISKISTLWSRVSNYNSILKGSDRPYNIGETWQQYRFEVSELVKLKTQIHNASLPVREDIFNLSETKSILNSVRSLSTTNGIIQQSRFADNSIVEMEAMFNLEWKDREIERLENLIESIQEKLDAFNHTTHI